MHSTFWIFKLTSRVFFGIFIAYIRNSKGRGLLLENNGNKFFQNYQMDTVYVPTAYHSCILVAFKLAWHFRYVKTFRTQTSLYSPQTVKLAVSFKLTIPLFNPDGTERPHHLQPPASAGCQAKSMAKCLVLSVLL